MNFLDAAQRVLQQARTPLHYADITRRAQAAKILDTKGQTPEATMGARLYVDTKKPNSRFRRVSRNVFALAENQPSGIAHQIRLMNEQTRSSLLGRLYQMPADRFEALIGELLLAIGFAEETLEVTRYTNDRGIDVRGILNAGGITEVKAAVQVKKWRQNVQAPEVQKLRGSLNVHEQGIVITTSKFSKGAQRDANESGKVRISLIDGDKLVGLLMKHGIGVKVEQHMQFSLDDEWWNEVASLSENGISDLAPASSDAISFPLAIEARAKEQIFRAELLSPNGRVRMRNIEYSSPSRAGQAATGWRSCNGWLWWHYRSPNGELRTIDEFRLTQRSVDKAKDKERLTTSSQSARRRRHDG